MGRGDIGGVVVRLTPLRWALAAGLALSSTTLPLADPEPVEHPVPVAVVVPLTVPPQAAGLIDAESLGHYTAPSGLLTRQLDAVDGTDATLGIDPMILASIRVLGASAPQSALDWLTRLSGLGNDSFLLAYADADPGLFATVDDFSRLDPTGFGFALDPDDFAEPGTATVTPAPTSTDGGPGEDAGPPPLPSTDAVLAWPATFDRVAWPAEGTVTADALAALVDAGYERVLLRDDNASSDVAHATVGKLDAAIIDGGLSSLFREAVRSITDDSLDASLDALDDQLERAARDTEGRSVVVSLDRDWPLGTYHLEETLDALDASPASRVVPLAEVFASPAAAATIVEPAAPTLDRAGYLRDALRGLDAEDEFASVLEDPLQLTGERELELLASLSVSWLDDPDGFATASAAFLERSQQIVGSVQLVEGSDLFAPGASTYIVVSVSNALDLPVNVVVTVRPLRSLLRIPDPTETLRIEPGSTGKVSIPAQAITNGQVPVRVTIASPTGVPLGPGRITRVDVQPAWETVGAIAFGVVVIVFIGGIVRNVVKRRRTQAAEPEATGADAADD